MLTLRNKSSVLGSFFFLTFSISILPAHADGVSGSAGGATRVGQIRS